MARASCALQRSLARCRADPAARAPGTSRQSPPSPVVCRETLLLLTVLRYRRDLGSAVYFPQAVLCGEDLYDLTVTDGDCRLRVTLDPGLNRLVERNVLRPGVTLGHASFVPALSARVGGVEPEDPGAESYRLVGVQVLNEERQPVVTDPHSLPWYNPPGPELPLRASRKCFLPLWNSVDPSGDMWRASPPDRDHDDTEEDQEADKVCPGVTVRDLRDGFLSGRRDVTRGAVTRQLIVRIVNKSHLMHYGKADRNCECPYKVVLQACDVSSSVCVVLWNSVCVDWYGCLRPGQLLRLSRYRVRPGYHDNGTDIEISVNSRNPAAKISLLPESSLAAEYLPPQPQYNFLNGRELLDCLHGDVCDIIGLLTFSGRPERLRSRDSQGAELREYRWLLLEDGSGGEPITVKLFSTSQPHTHSMLFPLSVVVCTQMKVIRGTDKQFYLTNTTYTQAYCTGQGQHSEMPYRKLRPVKRFLQWLQRQDDGQVLSRSLIGGFFIYPPPPVSLDAYMKEMKGEPGFLKGAELQREICRLCYRERRTFCIQATVTMVVHSYRGQEEDSLVWRSRSHVAASSPLLSPSSPLSSFLSSSPGQFRTPMTSSPLSLSSPVSLMPCTVSNCLKRKLTRQTERSRKRIPLAASHTDQEQDTGALWDASMEFIEKNHGNDEDCHDDEDEDVLSFVTAPLSPPVAPIAMETLPLRYSHTRREEQAVAVAMQLGEWREAELWGEEVLDSPLEGYYTLALRALSDNVPVDAVFLPLCSSPHTHANSWLSILSHGAFSSNTPPPTPADLINMAAQLANQRLVCVLEACHLCGAKTEVVLSRAFLLCD